MKFRFHVSRFIYHAFLITPTLLLFLAVVGAELPEPQKLAYPPTRRDSTLDDYNGVKVPDPYRWLEQLDSPETRAWVLAEARLTDTYLEKIPARQAVKQRLGELLDFEKFSIPFKKGERYVPFATAWMDENHFEPWPVAVYGFVLMLAGIAYFILTRTLISLHGRDSTLAQSIGRDLKGKISVVIYAAAIPLAFVRSWIAGACYILVAIMWLVPDPRIERKLAKSEE